MISHGDDETATEKRLRAELLESSRMISIDNCEGTLGGPLLCQTAIQHFIKVRVLGVEGDADRQQSPLIRHLQQPEALWRHVAAALSAGSMPARNAPESRTFAQLPLTVDSERLLPRPQRSLASTT